MHLMHGDARSRTVCTVMHDSQSRSIGSASPLGQRAIAGPHSVPGLRNLDGPALHGQLHGLI